NASNYPALSPSAARGPLRKRFQPLRRCPAAEHERANSLELTRGPFLGAEKVNCMAARWPHLAPSEALVSRGGQRAAVRPARVARAQLSKGRWADAITYSL